MGKRIGPTLTAANSLLMELLLADKAVPASSNAFNGSCNGGESHNGDLMLDEPLGGGSPNTETSSFI